jgi:hypothetical protein
MREHRHVVKYVILIAFHGNSEHASLLRDTYCCLLQYFVSQKLI